MTRWVPVGYTWLGHRPEPFIHERAWGCPLTGSGPCQAGFEGDRAVAIRHDDGYKERTSYGRGRIVIKGIVETILDDAGRPVRSVYPGGAEEHYRYDDAGRLVEIDESTELRGLGARPESGGRLVLTYDDQGLLAIGNVWERRDEPWPELLARGAREIADAIVSDIEAALEEPGPEIVLLSLTYVEDGGLHSITSLGGPDVRDDEMAFFYPFDEELGMIEGDGVDQDLEWLLMREAGMNAPELAQRTVLTEVARVLVRRDWGGLIRPTEDFVAFIAEHDEDLDPKRESLRAINPPERAELWLRRFPG